MARPREFDSDQAVIDAMNVFWAQGYEGASLPDLLDGMGITRGSLYKAFTDKKSLFLQVMTAYEEQAVAPAVATLQDNTIDDGLDRIEKVFAGITQAVTDGDQRGCLLCSAAAGPAAADQEIATIVHDLLGQMRDGFAAALSATPHGADSGLAEHLVTQYVGMRIMVRSHAPIEILKRSQTSLMALVKKPSNT
jgi:TetR/AcrR family transcriptional repressor of nem operon